MRSDAPAIDAVRAVRPARCRGSFVVRSPPLRLVVEVVFAGRLEIETEEITVFGNIYAPLESVATGDGRRRRIWQRIVVEHVPHALVDAIVRELVSGELQTGQRIQDGGNCATRVSR